MNLREKLWKGLGSTVIDVTVKKDSLLAYVLNFFGILTVRCGSAMVREKLGYESSGFEFMGWTLGYDFLSFK